MKISDLQTISVERSNEVYGHDVDPWTPNDWMTALAGEVGEAANLLKKRRRGEDIETEEIAKELADIQMYLVLLANELDIDLETATVDKFNEVSDRLESDIFIKKCANKEEEYIEIDGSQVPPNITLHREGKKFSVEEALGGLVRSFDLQVDCESVPELNVTYIPQQKFRLKNCLVKMIPWEEDKKEVELVPDTYDLTAKVIDWLNELLVTDDELIFRMIRRQFATDNEDILDDEFLICQEDSFTPLGLINGVLGVLGLDLICICFDEDDDRSGRYFDFYSNWISTD